MKKVIVLGCPGAGKSTFARKLRDRTGLPLFYLDLLWHKPDRTNFAEEEFDGKLREILQQDRWIIDGNYLRTLEWSLQHCDTVFLLDYSLQTCLEGVENRIGTKREEMPWIEEEFDPEFRQWIEDFGKDQLPMIQKLLEKYCDRVKIITFRSREEADRWLRK